MVNQQVATVAARLDADMDARLTAEATKLEAQPEKQAALAPKPVEVKEDQGGRS
jgi:hypothetical protein